MSEEALWYVVHTYSGYENKVKNNLEKIVEGKNIKHLIQDIRIPTEVVVEVKENERKETERKLFPGYVLIKMVLTDETWYIVRNIRGVTGFVGSSTKPVPLTEKEIQSLGVEKKVIDVSYEVGSSIKVVDGPLEGFIGEVEAIDTEKNLVKVVVSMFGRETPVELKLNQVALLK